LRRGRDRQRGQVQWSVWAGNRRRCWHDVSGYYATVAMRHSGHRATPARHHTATPCTFSFGTKLELK